MVEASEFTVLTDHKRLPLKEYTGKFTTDLLHISNYDNVVGDALSRVEGLQSIINYENLATSQSAHEKPKILQQGSTELRLNNSRFRGPAASYSVMYLLVQSDLRHATSLKFLIRHTTSDQLKSRKIVSPLAQSSRTMSQ